MAMSSLNLPVFPWLQAANSPQLDYVDDLTDHDADFEDEEPSEPGEVVHAAKARQASGMRRRVMSYQMSMRPQSSRSSLSPMLASE